MNKLFQKITDYIIVNTIKIKYKTPKGTIVQQAATIVKYKLNNGMHIGIGLNAKDNSAYVEFKHDKKSWYILDIFSIGLLSSFFNTIYYVFKHRNFIPKTISFVSVDPRRIGLYVKIIKKNFPQIRIEQETEGIFTKLTIIRR